MNNPLFDALFAPHEGSARPFLVLPDDSPVTYGDFFDLSGRVANALFRLGLQPGDRLAVVAPKSPMSLALYAGAVRAGVVLLPLNTAYTAAELSYFLANSGAGAVVVEPSRAAELAPIAAETGARLLTLDAGGKGTMTEAVAAEGSAFATVPRANDDLAALMYTSGTTGRSKGAMLTHANLLSNARVLAEAWRFTPDDVLLHALPVFHTHGLFVATNVALVAGASMILLPRFDVDDVLRWLPQATTMMGVPTYYTRLLADPRFDRSVTANMRLFTSGSAPLLAETHRRFEARTGHRILERYGMTETNMNTSNPYDGERRPGTVGPPLPGVALRVVDPKTGEPLPAGETGMIEVRGPNVFKGYWQMPERTAAEFRPDGFFITGDLGFIDGDGYVTIVGRAKDLVISGGLNVYPKEIETVLDEMPGVAESAVIGVPHPDFGEAVVAVLARDGTTEPDIAAIERAAARRLAPFKRPKAWFVVDALPRNTMGKVQKNRLRDRFGDIFSAKAR